MDAYAASEESYKNGYKQGYTDAMAEFDLIRPETSRRGAKFTGISTDSPRTRNLSKVSGLTLALATVAILFMPSEKTGKIIALEIRF